MIQNKAKRARPVCQYGGDTGVLPDYLGAVIALGGNLGPRLHQRHRAA
jgi:hypothetical protein